MNLTSLFGLIGIVAAAIFLIGLIRHDLNSLRRERDYVTHPGARKWRWRPAISLHPVAPLSSDTVKNLRRTYRKLCTSLPLEDTPEFTLVLTRDVTIPKDTLLAGLRYFIDDTTTSIVELIPAITPPRTTRQFLMNYRLLFASMFMKSRLGLGITPTRSLFPVLVRRSRQPQSALRKSWNGIYKNATYLFALCLPLVLTYGLYLAVVLHQPGMLLLAMGGVSIFLATAIFSYDHLSLRERAVYILLMPAAFGYLFLLAWIRPLEMLADMIKAKVPVGVGFFVRIKHILRIV